MPDYAIELENGLVLHIVGPQNAIDRVEQLVKENERLKVELEQCQQTLYRQIGLTIEASEEATKASATEVERLKAALREIKKKLLVQSCTCSFVVDNIIARTALKEDGE